MTDSKNFGSALYNRNFWRIMDRDRKKSCERFAKFGVMSVDKEMIGDFVMTTFAAIVDVRPAAVQAATVVERPEMPEAVDT